MNYDRVATIARIRGITPTQKLVLLMLAIHEGEDGLCCPKLQTLADECGVKKRHVYDAINYLRKNGFINTKSTGRTNIYTFSLENASKARSAPECNSEVHYTATLRSAPECNSEVHYTAHRTISNKSTKKAQVKKLKKEDESITTTPTPQNQNRGGGNSHRLSWNETMTVPPDFDPQRSDCPICKRLDELNAGRPTEELAAKRILVAEEGIADNIYWPRILMKIAATIRNKWVDCNGKWIRNWKPYLRSCCAPEMDDVYIMQEINREKAAS